ncbi:MAG: DUF2065 domain-containing protein [Parvibaculum sp.]|uniref:DUF2065 domain-containing protein n=1 Tax=Parvibaculum sp. TaxID=2024848 RepID=UPI0027164A10|nr:DUF2065 domain-containing protein [Parvibaculum sp.]MDO8839820.1 DUF2065 domain-containing protein [Parvibaculum sp.]
MDWTDLVTALGLAIALEGLAYAAFPEPMRRALAALSVQPEQALRMAGLVALAAGVFIVWLVRG